MRRTIAVAAVLMFLAVPATADASPVAAATDYNANAWMDNVMSEMKILVAQWNLDPMVMAPFQFKVKSNGVFNRDVKATFTRGSLYGLGGLRRQGECTYGSSGADMKLGCYVSLQTVNVLMGATVKGDQISGKTHGITTQSATSPNTFALLEFQGKRGYAPKLAGVAVQSVTLASSVTSGKLELNQDRMNGFIAAMNGNISSQLVSALRGYYSQALSSAISTRPLP